MTKNFKEFLRLSEAIVTLTLSSIARAELVGLNVLQTSRHLTKRSARLLLSWIVFAFLVLTYSSAHAQAPFVFENCRATKALTNTTAHQVGKVTRGFIKCFGDILSALDQLAQDANGDRLEVFTPSLEVYRQAVADAMSILSQAPGTADPVLVHSFEMDEIIGSHILDETLAFENIVNAPNTLVPITEKQDKGETVKKSVSDIIKKAKDALPGWVPDSLKKILDALIDVIEQLLGLLKGK